MERPPRQHETGGLAVQLLPNGRLLTQTASKLDTLGTHLSETATLLDDSDGPMIDSTLALVARPSARLRARSRTLGDSTVPIARYTNGSHTVEMIPLFASGPGAEGFGDIAKNWRVGELVPDYVRGGAAPIR